jgi:methylglyoxal synthase
MHIALIAHDAKKDLMVALARDFIPFLTRCHVMATGTTGERLLSGPLGGDLQIGARLAEGRVDAVIFLRDPMTPQPHEPDINALVRACDVHDVVCATNESSARHVLKALAAELEAARG